MLNLKLITPELLASVLTVTSTVWLLENTHKCAGTHTVMDGQMLESAYLEPHSPILTESLTHLSPRHRHTHTHTSKGLTDNAITSPVWAYGISSNR